MSLGIMTSSITMNSTMTLSIMTLGIKGFYVTFSINNAQHNNALPLCWILPFIYYYAECKYTECQYGRCHYAECQYAESRGTIYKSLFTHGSGPCTVKFLVYHLIGAMTLSITTLSITTLSKMTLNLKGLCVALCISDCHQNNALLLCWVSLMLHVINSESHILFICMLNIRMLSVVAPSTVLIYTWLWALYCKTFWCTI